MIPGPTPDVGGPAIPRSTRILHWLLAVLIVGMLILGKIVDEMDHRGAFELLRDLHINIGLSVLALGAARAWARTRHGFPAAVAGLSRIERSVARSVQWTLIFCTLLMPISGLVMAVARRVPVRLLGSDLLPTLPERIPWLGSAADSVHGLTAMLILICLVAHVGGALKHHLLDRDQVLARMLGRY